jgi:hypothetical protein
MGRTAALRTFNAYTRGVTQMSPAARAAQERSGTAANAIADASRRLDFARQALALRPDDPEAQHLRGTMRYIRWLLNLEPDPGAATRLLADGKQDLIAGEAASNPNRVSDLALVSHLYSRTSDLVDSKLAAMQAYEVDRQSCCAPRASRRRRGSDSRSHLPRGDAAQSLG